MTKTNLEQYKEELKRIFNENYDDPSAMFCKIKDNLDSRIYISKTDIGFAYSISCTNAILEWMAQPYKKPILDKAEREYLKAVIRPFRKEVATISKFQTWDESSQYIYISMKDNHIATLPVFPKGTMYKGMKGGKHYSLEELGL